jgi:hypothetical protein
MIGLAWLLLLAAALLFLQRRLHVEIQLIFWLLTRRSELVLALFSLLFLPGVFLHEASHYAMARLLRVRTGRFSLLPKALPNGRLQLGFVEMAAPGLAKDALIGLAPLLSGGSFVAYAGWVPLGLPALWETYIFGSARAFAGPAIAPALSALAARPDFWLWFYLVFVVSSTMLPSASDRRAWLPLGLATLALSALALLAGAGPWLMAQLAEPLNRALVALAAVCGLSAGCHLALLPPLWLLRQVLSRLLASAELKANAPR